MLLRQRYQVYTFHRVRPAIICQLHYPAKQIGTISLRQHVFREMYAASVNDDLIAVGVSGNYRAGHAHCYLDIIVTADVLLRKVVKHEIAGPDLVYANHSLQNAAAWRIADGELYSWELCFVALAQLVQ